MENMVGQTQAAQVPNTVQVPNYSGVNIQIFNPSVAAPGASTPPATINAPNYCTAPAYPANYYMQNLAQVGQVPQAGTVQAVQPASDKKKEKKEIVQLTDDYIMTLESYLDDQNKQIRLMGAKEVVARLDEDHNRKNDAALNALVNKMLQDPYKPVRFLAMAALDSRLATGNSKSQEIVKNIQRQKTNNKYDKEDSLKASNILLKMSSNTMTKEFEASENKKSKGETE